MEEGLPRDERFATALEHLWGCLYAARGSIFQLLVPEDDSRACGLRLPFTAWLRFFRRGGDPGRA